MSIDEESEAPTAYAVFCLTHGRVYLTHGAYLEQLKSPDVRWTCPRCGCAADFDDANYERRTAAGVPDTEPPKPEAES